jgi:hypothetical protein
MAKLEPKRTQGFDLRGMYASALKTLKKSLPKDCTLLAPFTNRKGLNLVKYIVNGKDYYSTIPPNFEFKQADFDVLREEILSKIKS